MRKEIFTINTKLSESKEQEYSAEVLELESELNKKPEELKLDKVKELYDKLVEIGQKLDTSKIFNLVKKAISSLLVEGTMYDVRNVLSLKEAFGDLTKDIFSDPAVLDAIRVAFIRDLSKGEDYDYSELKKELPEDCSIFKNSDVQIAIKKGITHLIILSKKYNGSLSDYEIKEMTKFLPLDQDSTEILRSAVREATIELLKDPNTNRDEYILTSNIVRDFVDVNKEESIINAAKEKLIDLLCNHESVEFYTISRLIKHFLQNTNMQEPALLSAALVYVSKLLNQQKIVTKIDCYNIKKVGEVFFKEREEEFLSIIYDGFINNLELGKFYNSELIRGEILNGRMEIIRNQRVVNAAKAGIIKNFERTLIKEAKKIKERYLFDKPEILKSSDLIDSAKEKIVQILNSQGLIRKVIFIKNEFLDCVPEVLSEDKIINAVNSYITEKLTSKYGRPNLSDIEQLKDAFLRDKDAMFVNIIKESLPYIIVTFSVEFLKELKEHFLVNNMELFEDEDIVSSLKEEVNNLLSKRKFEQANILLKEFLNDKEYSNDVIKILLLESLSKKANQSVLQKITEVFQAEITILLEDEEVLNKLSDTVVNYYLAKGDLKNLKAAGILFNNAPLLKRPEVINAIKELLLKRLLNKDEESFAIKNELLRDYQFSSQDIDILEAAENFLIYKLDNGDLDSIIKIKTIFFPRGYKISVENLNIIIDKCSEYIFSNNTERFEFVMNNFLVQDSDAIKKAIIRGIVKTGFSNLDLLEKIKSNFPVTQEHLDEAVIIVVALKLKDNEINAAESILEEFSTVKPTLESLCNKELLGNLYNIDIDIINTFFRTDLLSELPEEKNLTYVENIQNHFSNQERGDVEVLEGEEKYKRMFENLTGLKDTIWDIEGGSHEIAKAFEAGADVFGYEKMFTFIGVYDRHDALYAFSAVLALYEKSNLSPKQFYGHILHQVKMDNSVINDRDSYQKLNDIAQRFEYINLQEILKQASEYKSISSMEELLNQVNSVEDVFSNWKTLKKFDEIVDLLQKKELLEQLKSLSHEEKKMKEYIETLIFHPNINTSAVIKFWQDPATALNVYDEHSDRAHQFKKPSNYTEIPYLQLDALGLRDALVNGDLDKIQTFKPMEIVFYIPIDGEYRSLSIHELTKRALGSFREKIRGVAQNPKKLFTEVKKLLKKNEIDLQEFLLGKAGISVEIEDKIKDLLFNSESGLKLKMKEYRAKLSEKSDPDAVVAGNDTACCMPFGSGKNNVYTYNPNCGQFLVQERTNNEKWKTVAQSVLTKDINIKMPIPEIVEAALSGYHSMSEIVSDEILEKQKEIIVCDNIEVAPNAGASQDVLEIVYKEFFKHYLNTDNNLTQNEFLVGLGYNDLVFGDSVENTFLPTAPIGYSDNVGAETKKVSLTERSPAAILEKITKQTLHESKENNLLKGIEELTFADTITVSYIEGKAYADNQFLIEYMHNMENGLIAKDIWNTQNNRPNMSLKYRNNDGKMQGYMLAYEGSVNGEAMLYIADLAALPEAKFAGGRLMNAFLEEYKKNYLDKNDLRPIYAQARDKTSYRIMERQLKKLGDKVGAEFKMEQVGDYQQGGDTMHKVIIRVKKIDLDSKDFVIPSEYKKAFSNTALKDALNKSLGNDI